MEDEKEEKKESKEECAKDGKKCGCKSRICPCRSIAFYLCLTLLGLIICALSACKVLPLWVLIIGVAICAPQSFLIRKLDKDEKLKAISRDAGEKAGNATFKASVFLLACWSLCEYVAKAYSNATVLLLAVCALLALYWISYLLIKSGYEKKEKTGGEDKAEEKEEKKD